MQGPTFKLWYEFRRDYRYTDFSSTTQALLSHIWALAQAYNGAVNVIRKPITRYLADAVNEAVIVLRESADYKGWKTRHAQELEHPAPTGHRPKSAHAWYAYIDETETNFAAPAHRSVGEIIAIDWFRVFQDVSEAQTLGWLLGKRPDKAADCVWRKYPDSMTHGKPEQGWIYLIFDGAWRNIEGDSTVKTMTDIWAQLEQKVMEAENILEKGLQEIQQQFEGGEPLV